MSAKPKDAAWVLRMDRHGVQVLAVVMTLALVFTMVNVQQFAARGHPQFGVQWWIAWLLDPMASLTMASAIVYEGLLADYGTPKVHWLTATKWYAGVATWGMNIWSAAAEGSFAGIWLHSVAPGLVLLLAEAAPRVRRHMADIIDELEQVIAPAAVAPASPVAVDLPTPTYQRGAAPLAPSTRVAPPRPTPVVEPEPVAVEPKMAAVVEPTPTPKRATKPLVDVKPVAKRKAADVPVVSEPAPMSEPVPVAQREQPLSGADLDEAITHILDAATGPLGRRRIAALLPGPRPTDHALKSALARLHATRQPVLNGASAGATTATGSAGGGSDDR